MKFPCQNSSWWLRSSVSKFRPKWLKMAEVWGFRQTLVQHVGGIFASCYVKKCCCTKKVDCPKWNFHVKIPLGDWDPVSRSLRPKWLKKAENGQKSQVSPCSRRNYVSKCTQPCCTKKVDCPKWKFHAKIPPGDWDPAGVRCESGVWGGPKVRFWLWLTIFQALLERDSHSLLLY